MPKKPTDQDAYDAALAAVDAFPTFESFDLGEAFAAYTRAMQPATFFQTTGKLYMDMMGIAAGTSDIEPDAKDWRFKDEAWVKSPAYKRMAQAYLAMSNAIEDMIPDDLPQDQKARAEFAADVFASTIAPTNVLAGNPAAMKRTMETGGQNLVEGTAAFWRDLFQNEGLPEQVDDSGFEVGKNLATTPGAVVFRTEMFELIHYKPSTEKVRETPVVLIPPQIGRFYFTDLAPGRSFAEYTVSQGLQFFTVSWRNPSPENRDWGLEEYMVAALEALEAVREITGQPKLNVVGFCAGGMLTSMLMGYLKKRKIELINNATLCVTMLDFKSEAALGAFRLPAMLSVAKAQSQITGIHRGKDLHKVFTWMRPNDLVWNYWVNNYLMGDSPPAFDILAWNKDSTNLPAKLHKDFLDLFESNELIEPDAFEINGEKIDLSTIDCEKFVVGAVTDHLTPWQACYDTVHIMSGKSTFALSNGGHIAALVNPPGNPKAYHWISDSIKESADDWHENAEKTSGSWWESWTKWSNKRTGKKIAAPEHLGSKKYPPLCDAPGTYVREVVDA
ncbi:MAG: PHA/PHB synthase family protein [Alphaproteobacteria bacterium]